MRLKIKDIAYYLPEKIVTNDELHKENPTWDMDLLEERTGVEERHVAGDDETALDLAFRACEGLLSDNKDLRSKIDAVIFCTESGDYIMPPNACILHKMLDLADDVLAFDFNLACSGYIYGLALAEGLLLASRAKNVLLATADTYSKYINKGDRSARVLFGDGAAASWLTSSDTAEGLLDLQCSTFGKGDKKFIIPAGGCRMPKSQKTALPQPDASGNVRTLENIRMDGMGILFFVNSKVPKQILSVLARNNLTIDSIDLFVFHQASRMALDSLTRLLKIPPEKVFRNIRDRGNTVSASIPIALKDVIQGGRISKGKKVLISGFGVGLSWGTAILQI